MNIKNKTLISVIVIFLFFSAIWLFNTEYKNTNELSCIVATKKFLLWYKDNYTQINIVENNLIKTQNVEYYRVDFHESSKFIALLKSSGYVSNIFLEKVVKYISRGEENFKKIRQNDGPPEGFDFNLILLTQEYTSFLEKIPSNLNIRLKEEKSGKKIILIDNHLLYTFNKSCKLENIGVTGRETSNFY